MYYDNIGPTQYANNQIGRGISRETITSGQDSKHFHR